MILFIKNMVCDRCVMTVKNILASLGYEHAEVSMGKAEVDADLTAAELDTIGNKNAVIALVRRDDAAQENLSSLLTAAVGVDYRQMSAVFSAHEHRTIEKFYIAQKVERVKELIDYGELTVSEIAYATGYSSVAHLSRQFRQVTGMTPTQYKTSNQGRKPIDKV